MNEKLIPVGETIGIAWDKVSGSKGSFWGAMLVMFLIMFALGFADGIVKLIAPPIEPVLNVILQVVSGILQIGIAYIGIKRAQDAPINYRLMFRSCDGRILALIVGFYILQVLIILVPSLIIVFSTIGAAITENNALRALFILIDVLVSMAIIFYIIRISLSLAYILDQEMNPWAAIKQSYADTRGNFWRITAIICIQMLIIIVSIIPLGIGLIWSIPFGYILYGMIYKQLGNQTQVISAPKVVT